MDNINSFYVVNPIYNEYSSFYMLIDGKLYYKDKLFNIVESDYNSIDELLTFYINHNLIMCPNCDYMKNKVGF